MMRAAMLVAVSACAACDSDVTRPMPPPSPVELIARVNIQLGDTPAGQAPLYVVTGETRATRGSMPLGATIDSIVISYRLQDDEWLLDRKASSFPVVDVLPFLAQVDQVYSVRAIVYAHASSDTTTIRAQDEWVATARGVAAPLAHNPSAVGHYPALFQRRM